MDRLPDRFQSPRIVNQIESMFGLAKATFWLNGQPRMTHCLFQSILWRFKEAKRLKMTSVKLPPIYFFTTNLIYSLRVLPLRRRFSQSSSNLSVREMVRQIAHRWLLIQSLFKDTGAIFHRDVGLKAHSMSREKINWKRWWTEEWNFFPTFGHYSKSETPSIKTDTRLCLSADIVKMSTKTRLQKINRTRRMAFRMC